MPPRMTAAMPSMSLPVPCLGMAAAVWLTVMMPPMAAVTAAMMWEMKRTARC